MFSKNLNQTPTFLKDESQIHTPNQQIRNTFKPQDWSLDSFHIGKKLGQGRFGAVYLVMEKQTKQRFAIKIMSKQEMRDADMIQMVCREIEIQSHLRHENILKLYGYFQDQDRIYLILEYCPGGDLYKKLMKVGSFPEHMVANYCRQLAISLNYIHSKHIMHRDIKPENLLISQNNVLKISDFGWSVHSPSFNRNTVCGTVIYMPIEVAREEKYNEKADNWCIGVLCYELATGDIPFEGKDNRQIKKNITNLELNIPDHLSPEAQDFIKNYQSIQNKECLLEIFQVTLLSQKIVFDLYFSIYYG